MSQGATIWFTGLSGAGKSTIAELLERELRDRGARVEVLDGDVVRTHLSKGLGFSKADRDTNVLRIGWVCEVLARNGVVAIAAAISPYREIRDQVRARIDRFVEVYVDCPLDTCIARDVKGLYQKAIAGEIQQFTGISDPYDPPLHPEITIRSDRETPQQSAARIISYLEQTGVVQPVECHAAVGD
jgi:adenylyl-sulfate kinase